MSRIDRGLGLLQSKGVQRGIFGTSRAWFWIAVASWVLRRVRKLSGGEPVVVYRGELKPGHAIQIDHLTETYGPPPRGRGVLRRRRG